MENGASWMKYVTESGFEHVQTCPLSALAFFLSICLSLSFSSSLSVSCVPAPAGLPGLPRSVDSNSLELQAKTNSFVLESLWSLYQITAAQKERIQKLLPEEWDRCYTELVFDIRETPMNVMNRV